MFYHMGILRANSNGCMLHVLLIFGAIMLCRLQSVLMHKAFKNRLMIVALKAAGDISVHTGMLTTCFIA